VATPVCWLRICADLITLEKSFHPRKKHEKHENFQRDIKLQLITPREWTNQYNIIPEKAFNHEEHEVHEEKSIG
jgi:hypothetical protein